MNWAEYLDIDLCPETTTKWADRDNKSESTAAIISQVSVYGGNIRAFPFREKKGDLVRGCSNSAHVDLMSRRENQDESRKRRSEKLGPATRPFGTGKKSIDADGKKCLSRKKL